MALFTIYFTFVTSSFQIYITFAFLLYVEYLIFEEITFNIFI